jgi:hypothetical protein
MNDKQNVFNMKIVKTSFNVPKIDQVLNFGGKVINNLPREKEIE